MSAVSPTPSPDDGYAANYAHLVKAGGKVKYTVKLSTGHKDVPAGNQLAIQTNSTAVPSGLCALDMEGGTIQLSQDLVVTLPKNRELTCELVVVVNDNTHMQGGKVPPFSVAAIYSGPNTSTHEYYVEPQSTSSVPVYTGTYLDQHPTSELQGITHYGKRSGQDLQ